MATAIIMPRQGQSVESCILVEWLVEVGASVAEGDIVASIETDKATFEVESPSAGEILALFAEAGDDIPVLENIAAVGTAGEDVSDLAPGGTAAAPAAEAAPSAAPAEAPSAPATTPEAAQATAGSSVGVSPRARGAAAKSGVDATALAGTGPGGRVIERDVVAAAAAGPRLSGAAKDALAAGGVQAPATGSGPGGLVLSSDLQSGAAAAPAAPTAAAVPLTGQEVPLTGIRKIIAGRMKASLSETAQLTMTTSFDATALLAFRARVKANGEAMDLPNISINDLVLYAVARTLPKHPELNATFKGGTLTQFGGVNLGVAMDTPRGLMVPVLQNAHAMSLSAISSDVKQLAASAKEGSVNPDLLTGGTFTVTTLGAMGIETFTPVLNAPEVAILGVGGLSLKPVRDGKDIKHIDAMHLSLTIDHQVVDGAPGARFLKALATALENIDLTLAQ